MIKKALLLVNKWFVNEKQLICPIQLYQSIQCGTQASPQQRLKVETKGLQV